MQIEPSAAAFAACYAAGEPQVVWTTLVADLETPVSAIPQGHEKRFADELSARIRSKVAKLRGRYSIIGLEPDVIFRVNGARAETQPHAAHAMPQAFTPANAPPLQALRALIAESRIALPETLPPMAAGVFGYLGYDMVRLMEDTARRARSRSDRHSRCDAGAPDPGHRFRRGGGHHHRGDAGAPGTGVTRRQRWRSAGERLAAIVDALDRPLDKSAAEPDAGPLDVEPHSNTTADEFKRMVLRAKEYIFAGDVFQVVLSQRFEAPFKLAPFSLYRALRRVNPSPYLYFLDFGCVRGCRLKPGNAGQGQRRHRYHPPDCRHAAARRDAA